MNNKSRFNTQKSNQNTTMARTKGKKSKKCTDLDEETLKKIYTEKNYVQPEDTELETIEEAARETSNSSEIGEDNINDQHTSKHQKVWIFERARHIEVQFFEFSPTLKLCRLQVMLIFSFLGMCHDVFWQWWCFPV